MNTQGWLRKHSTQDRVVMCFVGSTMSCNIHLMIFLSFDRMAVSIVCMQVKAEPQFANYLWPYTVIIYYWRHDYDTNARSMMTGKLWWRPSLAMARASLTTITNVAYACDNEATLHPLQCSSRVFQFRQDIDITKYLGARARLTVFKHWWWKIDDYI
jgi:hypothetical protein